MCVSVCINIFRALGTKERNVRMMSMSVMSIPARMVALVRTRRAASPAHALIYSGEKRVKKVEILFC